MNTNKDHLVTLADQIQHAVHNLQSGDASSIASLQASITKLQRAITAPPAAILRQRFHTVENLCVIAAEEMGLFDKLSSSEKMAWTAVDLAAATGYDQTIIVRVMRVITAIGFADETGYQQYQGNPNTTVQNGAGGRGGFVLTNDFMFAHARRFREYFRQLKPCSLEDTMPAYDFGAGESIWETLRQNLEWKTGFDNAMTGRQKLFSTAWHAKFPVYSHINEVAATKDAAYTPTIVDIGGNQGFDLLRISEAYPNFECRLVLQDLPETVKGIPAGSLPSSVEVTAHDFFTPQPVHGATIYYMKSVLHDWDDTSSRRILSNTAKVMDGSSRILINDIVLADTNETVDRADMDVLMLFVSNGMERSRTQWAELLASASPPLIILKIWSSPQDAQSIIEARLADNSSS